MKKILLPIFSFLIISSISQAAEIDPDLKKPMLYTVEIQDSNHQTLYSTNINNLSNKSQSQSVENTYIDNCIKNKGIIESSRSSIKTGYTISLNEESGVANSLVINFSKLVDKKKINTGECNIEEAVIGSAVINQGLPFFVFEYKFHLKDSSGKELPELYYIKASGSVLRNQ